MPRYDDEFEMGRSDRPERQSRLMDSGMQLTETLHKLRALVGELSERLGPIMLPSEPQNVAAMDSGGMKPDREMVSPVADMIAGATRQANDIIRDVQALTRRIDV